MIKHQFMANREIPPNYIYSGFSCNPSKSSVCVLLSDYSKDYKRAKHENMNSGSDVLSYEFSRTLPQSC